MASLLWGGLFAFLSLYTLLMSAFSLVFLSQTVRRGTRFLVNPAYPENNTESHLIFNKLPKPFLFPGFHAVLTLHAKHSSRRHFFWQWKLSALDETARFSIRVPRGHYSLHFALEIRDVFGFTKVARPLSHSETLTVLPTTLQAPRPQFVTQGRGEKPDRTKKVRSQEMLEVRKYLPGDDVRRIHWGLYAHLGEPFLRIGEENPPPSGKVFLLIDNSVPKAYPPEDFLDHRLAQVNHFLATLGQPWVCLFPQADCPAVDSQSATLEQWARIAARLRAGEPSAQPLLNTLQSPAFMNELALSSVLIVSSQGCTGLAQLSQALSSQGLSNRPFLLPLPQEPARFKAPWWQRRASGVAL